MPQIGIRLNDELHHRLVSAAAQQNVSVSDFVRHAVEHLLNGCQTPSSTPDHLEDMREQIQQKDKQIAELHQLVALAQKNVAMLGEQLDASRKMLEDKRRTRWWHRFRL